MRTHTPVVKRLVLIGAGHTHVHVVKMFGMNPLSGVELILISRDIESPYSGMLPGHVAGFYTHDECHIDAARIARFGGVTSISKLFFGFDHFYLFFRNTGYE
jgi:selenide,water dikinase